MKEDPIFEFIPIEVLIKSNQVQYYDVLEQCDKKGESTLFIEFSCDMIHAALIDYGQNITHRPEDFSTRLFYAKSKLTSTWFARKDYLKLHLHISTATASRDLFLGIQKGLLKKQGEKN